MAEAGCEVNLFGSLCLLNFFLNHSFTRGDLDCSLDLTRAPQLVWSAPARPTPFANYRPMCRDNGVITAKMVRQRRIEAKDLTINQRLLVL